MASNFIDLTGKRFGRLTVLRRLGKTFQARWLCVCDCGKEHSPLGSNLRNGNVTSCGCYRHECMSVLGKLHPAWKGGRSPDTAGYVRVCDSANQGPKGRKLEHIAIMETRLGRKLYLDETVHHKNGIRSDNRDDNLELRVRAKHPKGATVPDLLKWANEVIARYQSPHLSAVIGR
jgi:hypothetical protein